jgi:type I restriction enzyme S subunit
MAMGNEGMGVWELPEGWEWIPTQEVGTFRGGGTPSKSKPEYWNGTTPWVSPKDMKSLEIQDTQDHVSFLGIDNSSAKLIPSGAVLVVFRSGILAHSLPVAIAKRELTVNQDLKAIVLRENFDPYYITFAILAKSDVILSRCTKKGATVHSLEYQRFRSEKLPIPYPKDPTRSLAEQRRIVARIEELFARIEEAQRLRAATDQDANRFLDAASAEVFSQSEAEGWAHQSFSDVWSGKARYGSFKKPQAQETHYPVIRVGNVVDGTLMLEDLKYLALTEQELKRCELIDGDVVVARAIGSRIHLGKCAVFRAAAPGKTFALDSHLIRVRLDKAKVNPDYVRHYLSSSIGRDEILRNSRQSAIQFNINVRELSSVKIPVPPLTKQRRIIEYLDGVQAQVAELKRVQAESAGELERLEGAILARAFRAEL